MTHGSFWDSNVAFLIVLFLGCALAEVAWMVVESYQGKRHRPVEKFDLEKFQKRQKLISHVINGMWILTVLSALGIFSGLANQIFSLEMDVSNCLPLLGIFAAVCAIVAWVVKWKNLAGELLFFPLSFLLFLAYIIAQWS